MIAPPGVRTAPAGSAALGAEGAEGDGAVLASAAVTNDHAALAALLCVVVLPGELPALAAGFTCCRSAATAGCASAPPADEDAADARRMRSLEAMAPSSDASIASRSMVAMRSKADTG